VVLPKADACRFETGSSVRNAGGPPGDLSTTLGWGMRKVMPESNPILEELRGIREELRAIANEIRLLLIYEVDPGAAALVEEGPETRGRLHADDAFVQGHHNCVVRMPAKNARS